MLIEKKVFGTPTMLNEIIKGYRLVELLGEGGMGAVYRAIHLKTGQVVALKILTTAKQNPKLAARFFNEVRIQSKIHHRNIVALYDFFELNSKPCLVMEFVEGETLDDLIRSIGCLSPTKAMYVFTSVVEAINYIHRYGIIHRDIKPENIKITPSKQIKLLDFGIAQTNSSPKVTVVGNVIGTTHYLSPERIKGKAADVKSDIWSLGVLLYEMITGCPPFEGFEGETLNDLYTKIIAKPCPLPSTFIPDVPYEIEAIISRCLQKKSSNRYQTARHLLKDSRRVEAKLIQVASNGKRLWQPKKLDFKSSNNYSKSNSRLAPFWERNFEWLIMTASILIALTIIFSALGTNYSPPTLTELQGSQSLKNSRRISQ